eukprot:c10745_g1_i2.p1 GENE.c10745_g1_i2~~c10745_g1_i2.p1  ORF type:complete len:360 (-),score=100.76 c10745_g1_i2:281-1330(-)
MIGKHALKQAQGVGGVLNLPRVMVGTYSWGDKPVWAYDPKKHDANIRETFFTCLDNGMNYFDTSDMYGRNGHAESMLGSFIRESSSHGQQVRVCSKYMPWAWRLNVKSCMRDSVSRSLDRLSLPSLDLYLISSFAPSWTPMAWLADALADVVERGLVKAVGVANANKEECIEMQQLLMSRGVAVSVNQVECSLLRTSPLHTGLKQTCDTLNVHMLAFAPLAMSRLTGRYSVSNPPRGGLRFGQQPLSKVIAVCETMQSMATHHHCSLAHVAVAYVLAKGLLPVVGLRHPLHAIQLAQLINSNTNNSNGNGIVYDHTSNSGVPVLLSALEVERLDAVSAVGSTNISWQHG